MSDTFLAQVVGLLGFALAFAAGATAVVGRLAGRRWWCGLVGLAAGAAAFAPAQNIPVAGYLRAVFGDLSITGMLVLASAGVTAVTGRRVLRGNEWTALCGWSVLAGLVLYPLTLGLTRVDPYALGFRPRALVLVLAAITMWSWWRRQRTLALVFAADVAAFNWRVLESGNLWDYVLDPCLFAWAAATLMWRSVSALSAALLVRARAGRISAGRTPVPAEAETFSTQRDEPAARDGSTELGRRAPTRG